MRRAALHLAGGVICLVATATASAASAIPQGPALPPRKPGFMLYFSAPLGGGAPAGLHPKFGFRLEQVRMTGNSGAPDAPDPMQHRGLIGWQVQGHGDMHMHFSDMRLELGNHVTFDMSHRSFGLTSRSASMTLGPRPIQGTTTSLGKAGKVGAELKTPGFRESASLLHAVAEAVVSKQHAFAASHRPQAPHQGARN